MRRSPRKIPVSIVVPPPGMSIRMAEMKLRINSLRSCSVISSAISISTMLLMLATELTVMKMGREAPSAISISSTYSSSTATRRPGLPSGLGTPLSSPGLA